MRALRNFKPNRCDHLISRIANCAYFLDGDEGKGAIPRRDWAAFREAVKDALKCIGEAAIGVGTRLISVPILLAPPGMIYELKTEDGRLGA